MKTKYEVTVNNHRTFWRLNGKLHRDDGPAVEWADGAKYWYKNGKLHRDDGPAYEGADGSKYWYKNGKYHRDDGPAFVNANGSKSWYIEGKRYSEKEFNALKNPCKTIVVDGKKYKLVPA